MNLMYLFIKLMECHYVESPSSITAHLNNSYQASQSLQRLTKPNGGLGQQRGSPVPIGLINVQMGGATCSSWAHRSTVCCYRALPCLFTVHSKVKSRWYIPLKKKRADDICLIKHTGWSYEKLLKYINTYLKTSYITNSIQVFTCPSLQISKLQSS
jgi:hypothetical protein